ncbi:uncharacterized protein TNCV_1020631 [Trichonephila clavipes]|uniref:Secreted protein n=1 Tax=Trichonephila clavipes TaxID=2585209 RepID=A0A8X6SWP5_TRICX|nr:uncharacterized protein TNCV_1020631 [Trichonephila clavipes]
MTDCKTIMGLLFVAMLETHPVFSKMILRLCFIAHQVSRNRCMGSVPSEKDSWCYYQRALSCAKKPNEKYKGLSNEVLNTIKPTYLELCTKELLTKCLHGKTQNSNECLNGVIWQRVPKGSFRVPQNF